MGAVMHAGGATRRKLPGGGWVDLTPAVDDRRHFQRTDGSTMTDEEITKVARGDESNDFNKWTPPPAHRASPHAHTPGDIWAAVQRLGTQVAAAKELGIKQGSIQSGLKRYMKAHGIEGPLPGKLTSEQLREAVQERAARLVEAHAARKKPNKLTIESVDAALLDSTNEASDDEPGGESRADHAEAPVPDKAAASWADAPGNELSPLEAKLLLSAFVARNTYAERLTEAEWMLAEFEKHGFELLIRRAA